MKKMHRYLAVVLFSSGALLAGTALAQSPFDGTWRIDHSKTKHEHKPFADYFPTPTLLMLIDQPLVLLEQAEKWDVVASAKGGGLSGQAGAIRLGISRQLDKVDPATNHSPLRKNGCLTRDPRAVERKKYGRRGARARFQFSKR